MKSNSHLSPKYKLFPLQPLMGLLGKSMTLAIGLTINGLTISPANSAIAAPLNSAVSKDQQNPIHQQLNGTWEISEPSKTSADQAKLTQLIFRSAGEVEFIIYKSGKLVAVERGEYKITSLKIIDSSPVVRIDISKPAAVNGVNKYSMLLKLQRDGRFIIETIDKTNRDSDFLVAGLLGEKIKSSVESPIPLTGIVPAPEQQAQFSQKLSGTWKIKYSENMERIEFAERATFRPQQRIEGLSYRYGRLFSDNSFKYKIIEVRNVNGVQLFLIKVAEDGPKKQSNEEVTYSIIVAFSGDRQIKMGIADNNLLNLGFNNDFSVLVDKISDSTEIPAKIPFKASNNSMAQREARYVLDLTSTAQELYRVKEQRYATSFSQLQNTDSSRYFSQLTNVEDFTKDNPLYSYRLTNIDPNRSTIAAIPKTKGLSGFISLIYYSPDSKSTDLTICESIKPRMTTLANPTVQVKKSGAVISCPRGSRSIR